MGFAADYDVTFPAERPPQGIDYVFQSTHATGPGDLTIRVRTVGGNDWTADARNGSPTQRSALSGLWSTPSPTWLCVVARGQAYLVDVGAPEGYSTLDTGGPVIQVKPAVADGLLLIASPWVVTALGEGGVLWRTERLAIDGLRLDEALGGRVAGVADPDDEEPRDFAIDLRTGAHEGGAFEHGVERSDAGRPVGHSCGREVAAATPAMNPRRRRAPELGDVLEIETPRGLAYAQYTHWHDEMGELIRVLPGLFQERPDVPAIVPQEERFFVFYPLAAAIREGLVQVIAGERVPAAAQPFPVLKSEGGIDSSGRVLNWWLWDGQREWRVDSLTPEEAGYSPRAIWGHPLLVQRIAEGWAPADEVRGASTPSTADGPTRSQHSDLPPTSPDHAVLQELEKAGADLSESRSVRHYLYFSSRGAARRAGRVLRGRDFVVAVEPREEGSWVVLADHRPVLALEGIERLRGELEALAAELGGEYDGWEAAVSE